LDPGSEFQDPGWVKMRIRDKHPGSTTTFIPTATSLALKCNGTFKSKKAKTLLKNFFMIIQTLSEK
jgi:hypothetical protein